MFEYIKPLIGMAQSPVAKKLIQEVEAFNGLHPCGTRVISWNLPAWVPTRHDAKGVETVTAGPAHIDYEHSWILVPIQCGRVRIPVPLKHIRVMPASAG